LTEPQLQPYGYNPEPRIRVKISDVAWGVFWGIFAWSIFAFAAFLALSIFSVSVSS
jgi:hypothetical protein